MSARPTALSALLLLGLPLVAGCVVAAQADDGLDALMLHDGSTVHGTVLGVVAGAYQVERQDGEIVAIPVSEVASLAPRATQDAPPTTQVARLDDPTRVRVGFDLYLMGGGLRVEKPYGRHNIDKYGFRGGVALGLGGYQVSYAAVIGYANFFVSFMPERSWHVEVSTGPVVGFVYGEPYPGWAGGFAFTGDIGEVAALRFGLNGAASVPGVGGSSYVGWFWPELGVSATF